MRNLKRYLTLKILLPVILILSIVGYIVYAIFFKGSKPDPSQTNQALQELENAFPYDAPQMQYVVIAQELGHNLGTIYPFYDPRHWTENDKEVRDLLIGLTSQDFQKVAHLYNTVVAKGNDLQADIIRLLDTEYYNEIRNILTL